MTICVSCDNVDCEFACSHLDGDVNSAVVDRPLVLLVGHKHRGIHEYGA